MGSAEKYLDMSVLINVYTSRLVSVSQRQVARLRITKRSVVEVHDLTRARKAADITLVHLPKAKIEIGRLTKRPVHLRTFKYLGLRAASTRA